MKLTYREENGIFYPNLELPEQITYNIGKYGSLHLDFIKKHRKGRYTTLVSECRMNEYLHEIDEQAEHLLGTEIPRLAARNGITEELKAIDPLRWVQEMNHIKTRVEEIVLSDIIYR